MCLPMWGGQWQAGKGLLPPQRPPFLPWLWSLPTLLPIPCYPHVLIIITIIIFFSSPFSSSSFSYFSFTLYPSPVTLFFSTSSFPSSPFPSPPPCSPLLSYASPQASSPAPSLSNAKGCSNHYWILDNFVEVKIFAF